MRLKASRLLAAELAKVKELRALLHDEHELQGASSIFKSDEFNNNNKLNRILLEFGASSCLVDLCATEQPDQNTSISTPSWRPCGGFIRLPALNFNSIQVSEWGRKARRKLWPYLIFLLWFVCMLHLSFTTYYQYAHDYYEFRLVRVRWFNQTQPPEVLRSYKELESEQFLQEQLESDRFKQFGASSLAMSFVVQCMYLHIMIASFLIYFLQGLYFARISPFNFYFLRNLFDFEREQQRNEQFVRDQADKFAASIGSWSQVLCESGVITQDSKLVSSCGSGLIDCATVRGSQLCHQLREMLAVGLLRPLNQRAAWVRAWAVHYSRIIIVSYFYAILTSALMIWLQIHFLDRQFELKNTQELLIQVDLIYLLITIQISVGIYGATLVFTCWDQAVLVNKLRKMLKLTVELNDLRFYGRQLCLRRLGSPAFCPNETQHQINRDVLLVLMHYRIFSAQLVKLKRPLSFIALNAVFIMFLTPTLGRLHVPYFSPLSYVTSSRQLVVLTSILIAIPANIYLVPVCYLNRRCVDFYRELNSLLAHVTQISHLEVTQNNEHLAHDRYIIISLLRKELAHHDQVTRQLAIRFFGVQFTYASLVRLHFYVGFILLTIMGENLAQLKEPTGTIFSDPLGLF